MAEPKAGLELIRKIALQADASAADLKAQKQADASGSKDIAQAVNVLLASRVSELEAQLAKAKRQVVAYSAGRVRKQRSVPCVAGSTIFSLSWPDQKRGRGTPVGGFPNTGAAANAGAQSSRA